MQPARNDLAQPARTAATACVFFGEAGVGKSTLINQILSSERSRVSHDITVDGTMETQVFHCSDELFLVDTPGLDSGNTLATSTQVLWRLHGAGVSRAVPVLVVDKRIRRVKAWGERYLGLGSELLQFSSGGKRLIVVWTNEGELKEASKQQLSAWFTIRGYQPQVLDAASEHFRREFLRIASQPTSCCAIRPAPTKPPNAAPQQRKLKAGKLTPAHTTPTTHETLQLLVETAFTSAKVKARPSTILPPLVKQLFELKHNSAEANKFKDLKMMGDALLRVQVYAYLRRRGDSGNWDEASRPFLTNSAESALVQFFERFVAVELVGALPEEGWKDHSKADFVEALIAFANTKRKKKQRAYDAVMYHLLTMPSSGAAAVAGEEEKQSL